MSKTVVDNQCLFRTDDERLDQVPFDNVTHICCEKGVEYKIQNGTELECCGGSKLNQQKCNLLKFYLFKLKVKSICEELQFLYATTF